MVSVRTGKQRHLGFTLIELLTVIAIIAVLAAILFPVFSRARASARKMNCLANLKQIGEAMTIYENDHGGRIVTWCITNPNPMAAPSPENAPDPAIITWDLSILSYLRNIDLVKCKDNPVGGRTARAFAIARYTQKKFGANYFGGYKDDIPAPTKTVLLFEKGANAPGSWGDALGENVYQSHNTYGAADYSDEMFHFDGKNFLFVDGHAKWFKGGTGPFARAGRAGASTGTLADGVCQDWGRRSATPVGDWPERD